MWVNLKKATFGSLSYKLRKFLSVEGKELRASGKLYQDNCDWLKAQAECLQSQAPH